MGVAAEHGFFYRPKTLNFTEEEWQRLLKQTEFMWIESVRDIMKSFSEKTDGACIEEKESFIVWNYKDSDQELGKWQARELTLQLEHIFSYLLIEVVQGK